MLLYVGHIPLETVILKIQSNEAKSRHIVKWMYKFPHIQLKSVLPQLQVTWVLQ